MRIMLLYISVAVNMDSLNAQWVQSNGPYGGDITCFAVDSTTIFAGTYSGGVYSLYEQRAKLDSDEGRIDKHQYSLALAADGTNLLQGLKGATAAAFLSRQITALAGPPVAWRYRALTSLP